MKDYLAFFTGRVEAEARGGQLESFINQLHRRRIPIRKPRRTEDGTLIFLIPRREFGRLRQPAFKTGTRIRIRKKQGLFMVLRPFRKRWGLAVGFLLFLGMIYYCSCFIWQIEVVGCEETSAVQIKTDLAEMGLKIGAGRKIDVEPIENRYLTGNEKLSWMSINIRGTTAYVEVREKGVTPEVPDETMPTSIYASRDGVILSIQDYGGFRQVEVGEAVSAGDLLVSGAWTDRYGVRHLTHSIATITAQTYRETEVVVALQETVRQKTGKSRKKYAISFGKLKIPLYFNGKISYNEYDTILMDEPLRIGSFALPVRFYVERVEEVETVELNRTPEEAAAEAKARLAFYQKDVLADVVIRDCTLYQSETEDAVRIRAVFECEEEIGVELPIEE